MSPVSPSDELIFLTARRLGSAEARRAYLDQTCRDDTTLRQQVEALLAAYDASESFLESPAPEVAAVIPARNPAVTEQAGTLIGPYRLLEQIGEGGFGVVFMAEQSYPVRRNVALKVLKPGMDTRQVVARFEAERQALALMEHPNIAHVLDGGTTASGRPYFVMELVRGTPITDSCDRNKMGLRERVGLFIDTCQAVQHAHQKGIIHRDLKPSNIMVTVHDELPVVKIIDFGIAKVTGPLRAATTLLTNAAQMVGTPMYMSPEQAQVSGVDIDTRSDIYSLGVLLYELLTGTTPFDAERLRAAAYDEMRRIIREEEPPRPSVRVSSLRGEVTTVSANRQSDPARRAQLLRGDLDWIVMKCVEKDRDRRYESAAALAADLQRHLDDEPVLACPPSAAYRLRKFARRHRVGLGVCALVATVLVLAVAVLAASNVWVRREKNEKTLALREKELALTQARINEAAAVIQRGLAQENLEKSLEAVDQMLTRVGQERLRDIPLVEQVRRELLEDALRFYEEFLAQRGDVMEIRSLEALAHGRVGKVYFELGKYVEAERSLVAGITRLEELRTRSLLDADSRLELADLYTCLGSTLWEARRHAAAVQAHRNALAHLEQLDVEFPDTSPYRRAIAAACTSLGACLIYSQPEEAEVLLRRAIRIAGSESHADRQLALACHSLAHLLMRARRWSEAEVEAARSLDLWQTLVAANPTIPLFRSGMANALVNRGMICRESGLLSQAEASCREALAIVQRLAAEFPTMPSYQMKQARCHADLGQVQRATDKTQAAENFRQAAAIYEGLAAELPSVPAGRHHPFESVSAEESRAWQDFNKLDHWYRLAGSRIELGRLYAADGRHDDAENQYSRVLEISEDIEARFREHTEYRADLARTQKFISRELYKAGRPAESLVPVGRAIRHYEILLADTTRAGLDQPSLADCLQRLGQALAKLGQWRDAETACRKAIAAGADSTTIWSTLAAVQLAIGDMAGYRESCAHMLKRFDQAEGWTDANTIAWFCLLSPESGADFAQLVGLAEKALERKDPFAASSYRRDVLNTLGLALYRAGRYQEAIDRLADSIAAHAGGGDPWDWFFLAMAHGKLGHEGEARQWYNRAVDWIDQNPDRLKQNFLPAEELRRFRAEANVLLERHEPPDR